MANRDAELSEMIRLGQSLDRVATLETTGKAAMARRQVEALLEVALQAAGGNYGFMLAPAGDGYYAEQFVRLAGVVQRDRDGRLQSRVDVLSNRRPDSKVMAVTRLRRGLKGKSADIGLPLCMPSAHPPIAYFLMVPVAAGQGRVMVMVVANPTVRPGVKPFRALLKKLIGLGNVLTERLNRESTVLSRQASRVASRAESLAVNPDKRSLATLEKRIRKACELREFTLAYQPQFRLDNESIVSFEALLRWTPEDIQVPDTEHLVEVLEYLGLIGEVGQWVLETACQQLRQWRSMGLVGDECTMSVNVSPVQLERSDYVPRIAATLERYNLSAEKLNLEITESVEIAYDGSSLASIRGLKAMGVQLSLDDFGTGYSSLSYLTKLPVDTLKLDKSFVMAMNDDAPCRAVVMSVLAMAVTLNIDVVAEGIENTLTLEQLRSAQCKYGQGYLIAKPQTAAQLEPFLVRKRLRERDVVSLA